MPSGCIALLALIATLVGCAPRVGNDCPPEAARLARTIVHRRDGLPAYAGQALMITSCGGGAFCHSEGASERYGAPHDLDFDPELADQVADLAEGPARLRRAQIAIYDHREEIFETVVDGSMPPGALGRAVRGAPYGAFDADGAFVPMGGLDTATGRETLRNWLACAAPVIERTSAARAGVQCDADDQCVLSGLCLFDPATSSHRCAPVGPIEPYRLVPIEPTWDSIYEVVIATRCAQGSCHGAVGPAAGLDLSTRDGARMHLLSQTPSVVDGCAMETGHLVVPGDPDASLFYRKLTDTTVCGGTMPRGGGLLAERYTDAIRDWIATGAN